MVGRAGLAVAVALAVGLLASGPPVERWLTRHLGGAGAEPSILLVTKIPEGEDVAYVHAVWRRRLRDFVVEIDGTFVEVIGAGEGDARMVHGALTNPGDLYFTWVLHDTEVAKQLFRSARQAPQPGIRGEADFWRHDESGKSYDDLYLTGWSEQALDDAIFAMGATFEDGQTVVHERVVPTSDAEDREPYFRSYIVEDRPFLTGADVAHAEVVWDPYTGRPEVLIELTAEGRYRFGEQTARRTGHKLAIILGGLVRSAPVVQSAITGGRSHISMGGGDAAEQEAEATALVAVLDNGARVLPYGISAGFVDFRSAVAAKVWMVRIGAGLLAGLLAFLGAMVVTRRRWLAPAPRVLRSRPTRGAAIAVPALLTALVLLACYLAERVMLPGLDLRGIEHEPMFYRPSFSVVALGIGPVLLAFAAVEAIAVLLPGWRERRRGSIAGRGRIDLAVAIVAVAIAFAYGWEWVKALQALTILDEGLGWRLAQVLFLVGGVMFYVVAAALISRIGVCSGWVAIGGIAAARMLVQWLPDTWFGARTLIAVAALGAIAALVLVTRRTPSGRRPPAAGIAPLLVLPFVVAVVTLPGVDAVFPGDLAEALDDRGPVAEVPIVGALAAIWAWFAGARRPGEIATAVGFALLFLLLAELGPHGASMVALLGALVAVAAVDVLAGVARLVRIPDGVPLAVMHDVARVDAAAAALAAAGVPSATVGGAPRALLRGFGAMVPVALVVPEDRVAEAAHVAELHLHPVIAQAGKVFE